MPSLWPEKKNGELGEKKLPIWAGLNYVEGVEEKKWMRLFGGGKKRGGGLKKTKDVKMYALGRCCPGALNATFLLFLKNMWLALVNLLTEIKMK